MSSHRLREPRAHPRRPHGPAPRPPLTPAALPATGWHVFTHTLRGARHSLAPPPLSTQPRRRDPNTSRWHPAVCQACRGPMRGIDSHFEARREPASRHWGEPRLRLPHGRIRPSSSRRRHYSLKTPRRNGHVPRASAASDSRSRRTCRVQPAATCIPPADDAVLPSPHRAPPNPYRAHRSRRLRRRLHYHGDACRDIED